MITIYIRFDSQTIPKVPVEAVIVIGHEPKHIYIQSLFIEITIRMDNKNFHLILYI